MPDGRFYTKANFFTMADRENAEQMLSSADDPLQDIDIRQNFRSANISATNSIEDASMPFNPAASGLRQ